MKVTEENREAAMQMLGAMVVEELALESGMSTEEAFKEFRKSKTFAVLFDPETGLWLNGPDYIVDEYKRWH